MFDAISKAIVDAMLSLGVWNDIIVNGVGVIALAFLVVSYQMKDRTSIFNVYLGAAIAWIFYFLLQGNIASVFMNIVAIVRTLIFKLRGKYKWVDSKWTLVIFLVVMLGLTALSFRDWRDIFPLLATAFSTFAFFAIKEKSIRVINLGAYIAWILNGATCGYWVALACDSITFISLVIALIRFSKVEKREVSQDLE
jgi:uncharacterized protein YacL